MKKEKYGVKVCLSKGKVYIYIYINRFVGKTYIKKESIMQKEE
jgi:hypothetical protein